MESMNSSNVISRVKSLDGIVEYHVLGVATWDHFDSLVSFFEKYYFAEVISKEDVIFTRKWVMKCEGESFILCHHDDIGNYFYSCTQAGDSHLMMTIANDLSNRLKDVGYEKGGQN
jgi:hypothetical protein